MLENKLLIVSFILSLQKWFHGVYVFPFQSEYLNQA